MVDKKVTAFPPGWPPLLHVPQASDRYLMPRTLVMEGDVIMPNTQGSGILVGDTDASDYSWRDIIGKVELRGVGANDPAWAQIGSSVLYGYNMEVADQVWITYHMPHDYVPGTDIYFHSHWIPDGTNAQSVVWEFSFAYALGFAAGVFPVNSVTTVTVSADGPGVAYTHMISETAAVTVNSLGVDGLIHTRVRRITNGATNNTDNIFLLEADLHYQGSNIGTKNRTPDFYT